jgi:hypothetical protein
MKAKQMLVLSVVAFGLQGIAQAAPYPSDAEASYDLPAIESYAEQQTRVGDGGATWGVTSREVQTHEPFPFGGGSIDD